MSQTLTLLQDAAIEAIAATPHSGADGLISAVLEGLVISPRPETVFTSLVHLLIPGFSDECVIELRGLTPDFCRIVSPALGPRVTTDTGNAHTVRLPINTHATADHAAGDDYTGTATFTWRHARPGPAERSTAVLLVRHCTLLVEQQRCSREADLQRFQAQHLEIALQSNRQIGTAIGVLMYSLKVTEEQAFGLLKTCSQQTHRKLRDIARDVMETGCIAPYPSPARPHA